MKFAKEIEQDLVPEWRVKYLDYKTGKKKVKAVARAFRNVDYPSPRLPGPRRPGHLFSAAAYQLPIQYRSPFGGSISDSIWNPRTSVFNANTVTKASSRTGKTISRMSQAVETPKNESSAPVPIPDKKSLGMYDEESRSPWDSVGMTNYGSIISSPPRHFVTGPPLLELPDPAISPNREAFFSYNGAWRNSGGTDDTTPATRPPPTVTRERRVSVKPRGPVSMSRPADPSTSRGFSSPGASSTQTRPALFRRLMSVSGPAAGTESPQASFSAPQEAYREFDLRKSEFFQFLDKELDKIETFYKLKETEATERLQILREQLHEMRDRRVEELLAEQRLRERIKREAERGAQTGDDESDFSGLVSRRKENRPGKLKWLEHAIGRSRRQFKPTGKGPKPLSTPTAGKPQDPAQSAQRDGWQDFSRRAHFSDEVPYRVAKRKLKPALQEFYRGLELLKSYALLNRTAFRKINKKYDKAVNARFAGHYTAEKVNTSWFVQSEVIDRHIVAVEDLYARYFERGNHKLAVSKLRSKELRGSDFNSNVLRNGLFLGAGVIFGIQGIGYGYQHLLSHDPVLHTNTSYLLQIYGGYFLCLLLFLIFCLDCKIWTQAKINYVFIFEFDTRHNLDWRQLCEIPCFLFFLEGLIMWLNFQTSGNLPLYRYWPVVLIGFTVLMLFFPAPIFYHRSRAWWAYSNFRLLLAGLYPVEFRDFMLGDMYSSQTYAAGNIELFFCLYGRNWEDPNMCNSISPYGGYVLGAFSALPGFWRLLQCLRRYYDTQNAFPHLVNCGKYAFTILYYMTLCLYRIDSSLEKKALFIVCATINSIYSSIWDIAMDWSLCDPYSVNPWLRDVLGYKHRWVYYVAMIINPLLRFNWVFYALQDYQRYGILSFAVASSEVCRRGMWALFRVENEHCTNVGHFRASRDIPLPYGVPSSASTIGPSIPTAAATSSGVARPPATSDPPQRQFSGSGVDLESAADGADSGLRRRPISRAPATPISQGIARMSKFIGNAHAQDFERKKPVPALYSQDQELRQSTGSSEEEEEEEEEEEDFAEELDDPDKLPDVGGAETSLR